MNSLCYFKPSCRIVIPFALHFNSDFVHGKHDQAIYQCIQEGLGYLDSRTEFWRQQKPLYARKKQKKSNKDRRSKSPTHRILKITKNLHQN